MRTILVTGGAGFCGTNAAVRLLKEGYKIIAFDSLVRKGVKSNLLKHINYEFVKGDVRRLEDLKPIKADAIIHLAANPSVPGSFKDPDYDFLTNALGTFNILQYARKQGNIPVIYNSTNKVFSERMNTIELSEWETRYIFGKPGWINRRKKIERRMITDFFRGIDEEFPVDGLGFPHSPYGVSKLTGDLLCQEWYHAFKVPTIVNRCSCMYGKYQQGVEDQGWVAWFMIAKILEKPLTIFGDGKQVRDALYGEDLAELYSIQLKNLLGEQSMAGEVFNVGGGPKNTISLLEAIELIEAIDRKRHKRYEITHKPWRFADQKVYYSDITKISSLWEPKTSVSNGFNQTYHWILDNKKLFEGLYK